MINIGLKELSHIYAGDRKITNIYIGNELVYDEYYYSKGLEYLYDSSTNSYTILGIGSCTDILIKIPKFYSDDINGKHKVTSIAEKAFKDNTNIVSIVTPSSITSIGEGAFQGCINLKNAELRGEIISLENYLFSGCSSLEKVNFKNPSFLETIETQVFYGCTSLKSFDIPSNVYSIGYSAFHNSGLEIIFIPISVTSLAVNSENLGVFDNCNSLKIIYCEASSKPDSWNDNWNSDDKPVVWGVFDNKEFIIDKTTGKIYRPNSNNELIIYDATSYLDGASSITIGDKSQTIISKEEFTVDTTNLSTLEDGENYLIYANNSRYLSVKVVTRVLSTLGDFFKNNIINASDYIFHLDNQKATGGDFALNNIIGYYVLANNIDMKNNISVTSALGDVRFIMHESYYYGSTGFMATLDGRGFALSNITVDGTSGIFGLLNKATIKNIAFIDMQNVRHDDGITLMARSIYNSTFENIYIKAKGSNTSDTWVNSVYFGGVKDVFGVSTFNNVLFNNQEALLPNKLNERYRCMFGNNLTSKYSNTNVIGLPSYCHYYRETEEENPLRRYILKIYFPKDTLDELEIDTSTIYYQSFPEKFSNIYGNLLENIGNKYEKPVEYIQFFEDTVRGYYLNGEELGMDSETSLNYSSTGYWTLNRDKLQWTSLTKKPS